jgi:hypothetical protein
MATNLYFKQGARSEQLLYEDLIVESLKMYGQDVYYMPRDSIDIDDIFKDESSARFDNAYKIEMYIENVDGFNGEGDLFTKFGVEIRDQATFIVSRRRWLQSIAPYENDPDVEGKKFYRPREGDLISLPLSGSIFEITKVFDETPFYQLKDLPVFRLNCELFEYSGEDFDTGINTIDNVEKFGYTYNLTFDDVSVATINGTPIFEVGEKVTQVTSGYTLSADVVAYNASNPLSRILSVVNFSASDGLYHSFNLTDSIVGESSGATARPIAVAEQIENSTNEFQNSEFQTEAAGLLDFSENNPFGDP